MGIHKRFDSDDEEVDVEDDSPQTEEAVKWFNQINPDPDKFVKSETELVERYKTEAQVFLNADSLQYDTRRCKSDSDYQWTKSIMNQGTTSDKIAAFTIMIQDSPQYNLNCIKAMINMVKSSKKRDCIMALDALCELFLNDLLKPYGKLKLFKDRPFSELDKLSSGNNLTRRKYLVLWYFEDQLKGLYSQLVDSLKTLAGDTVDANKEKAVVCMNKLLCNNSELEQILLSALINKLGDPSQKVASKVIYCLGQLLSEHPNMKQVVVDEVEKLMFRPNVNQRTQYYSMCFLTHFRLSSEDEYVAKSLVKLYFAFFRACVKKNELNIKMMTALLMGVRRAVPFAKVNFDKFSEHINDIFRIAHVANFNVSLQALCLLQQICGKSKYLKERFYCALYKKLLSPDVFVTTQQAMWVNLYYKALQSDSSIARVKAFFKRLLQIALYASVPLTCGILFLLSQIAYESRGKIPMSLVNLSEKKPSEPKLETADEDATLNDDGNDDDDQNDIDNDETQQAPESRATFYDRSLINPLFCGGEFCVFDELFSLAKHFHPTVSLFASNLIEGTKIQYSGDPLKDFQLIRFLDRFVFKNPKKYNETPSTNLTFSQRKMYTPIGAKALPVISSNYLNQDLKKIPIDEVFLYEFLRERQSKKSKEKVEDEDDSDMDSVASEEFEDMLERMMGGSKDPDLDFLSGIGDDMKKQVGKALKKQKDEEDEGSDEESEDEDEDEDEDEEDFDEDFDDDFGSDEEEPVDDFSDDEEPTAKSKKGSKKKHKDDLDSVFADVDEFATILEDEGHSEIAPGTSDAIMNKDRSHKKQLAWENKRHNYVNKLDSYLSGKKRKENFNKKRKSGGKLGNTNKKVRK